MRSCGLGDDFARTFKIFSCTSGDFPDPDLYRREPRIIATISLRKASSSYRRGGRRRFQTARLLWRPIVILTFAVSHSLVIRLSLLYFFCFALLVRRFSRELLEDSAH